MAEKSTADWYTPTVEARAKLGEALVGKGAEWLRSKRLKLSDVQPLVTHGRAAKQADREQHEQRAAESAGRKGRSADAVEVTEREAELSAVLPAVIDDLKGAGENDAAQFLANLTFARYRVRVTSVPVDPSAPPDAETKKVERVEKSDLATRADGLAALCAALRREGREAIQRELAERGFDAAALQDLELDATAVAEQGRNSPRPVEATKREREAVKAQRAKWSAVRRLLKRAVEGDPTLEALYAKC